MAYIPMSSLTPKDRLKTICVRVSRKWEFRGINDEGPLQHIDLVLADDQVRHPVFKKKKNFFCSQIILYLIHIPCVYLQGNTIYAEIPSAEADRLGPLLEAGKIYTLSRLRICNSKDYFKSVPGPYMLELTCHTKISPTNHQGPFPEYIYNLTHLKTYVILLATGRNSTVIYPNRFFLLICSTLNICICMYLLIVLFMFSFLSLALPLSMPFIDILGVLIEVAEPVWVHFSKEPKPKLHRNIVIKDHRYVS